MQRLKCLFLVTEDASHCVCELVLCMYHLFCQSGGTRPAQWDKETRVCSSWFLTDSKWKTKEESGRTVAFHWVEKGHGGSMTEGMVCFKKSLEFQALASRVLLKIHQEVLLASESDAPSHTVVSLSLLGKKSRLEKWQQIATQDPLSWGENLALKWKWKRPCPTCTLYNYVPTVKVKK